MREQNCIFCQVAAGEAQSWKVHEADHALAFLDIHPVNEYHTLVIPKTHYASMLDVPDHAFLDLMATVKYVIDMYNQKLGISHVQVINSSGAEAQQDVFHLHYHIVPRHRGDGQDIKWTPHPEMTSRFDEMIRRLKE
jgi:histidine triad (HIT) family protein